MSRERDLLRKILDKTNYINYACNDKIRNEIMEFLSQPEQTEQEPVAWMSVNNNGGISIDSYYANHKDYVPLYLTPPKRETLSEKEIREGNQSMLNATREAFIAGVRFAEKAHGIGVK